MRRQEEGTLSSSDSYQYSSASSSSGLLKDEIPTYSNFASLGSYPMLSQRRETSNLLRTSSAFKAYQEREQPLFPNRMPLANESEMDINKNLNSTRQQILQNIPNIILQTSNPSNGNDPSLNSLLLQYFIQSEMGRMNAAPSPQCHQCSSKETSSDKEVSMKDEEE